MMFKLEKVNNFQYEIVHENGKTIGLAIMLEDGYYHIGLNLSPGSYWTDDSLIQIGLLVKELNKPYDDHVKEFFEKEKDLDDLEKDIDETFNSFI